MPTEEGEEGMKKIIKSFKFTVEPLDPLGMDGIRLRIECQVNNQVVYSFTSTYPQDDVLSVFDRMADSVKDKIKRMDEIESGYDAGVRDAEEIRT
jgi:hypothetical protein